MSPRTAVMQCYSEADLAAVVVHWLRDHHWTVYQEVQPSRYGRIIDIVATQNMGHRMLVWVVECKRSLSLDLLAQCWFWLPEAHYVSAAVPRSRTSRGKGFAIHIAKSQGIGVLEVHPSSIGSADWTDPVQEVIKPQLRRKIANHVRESLVTEQQSFAEAGNNRGKRWTPFQRTCQLVRDAVETVPGLTLKELVDRIDHHYASDSTAKACLAKWGRDGVLSGVECRLEQGRYRFYVSEKTQ